jgi:hypothetical protein
LAVLRERWARVLFLIQLSEDFSSCTRTLGYMNYLSFFICAVAAGVLFVVSASTSFPSHKSETIDSCSVSCNKTATASTGIDLGALN